MSRLVKRSNVAIESAVLGTGSAHLTACPSWPVAAAKSSHNSGCGAGFVSSSSRFCSSADLISRIAGAVDRVFQVTRKRCDMRVINAGIGGNLIGRQFTTLPGSVERMLEDGSFANQIVQGAQGFFGCHSVLMLRLPFAERKPKKSSAGVLR
jgi:hypothetical protein